MNPPSAPGRRTGWHARARVSVRVCRVLLLPALLLDICAANPASGKATETGWLDIDQLARIKITSVSKAPEPVAQTAAAAQVITADDIRRSGATSIPEALRLAPGLDVARLDAYTWAVSSRGFNGQFSDKMLVLMDGRSVYSPLFSGTFWDMQDYLLEDLDRIEVVNGPGGTLWGANAVNGVINVVSKDSRDTQGTLLTSGAGSRDLYNGGARYGGKIGETGFYRVYGKFQETAHSRRSNGSALSDDWKSGQGGFRSDWLPTDSAHLTVQGDVFAGGYSRSVNLASPLPPRYSRRVTSPLESLGGNLLGRWTRTFSEESDLTIQAYYDHFERNTLDAFRRVETFDLDLQHRFALGSRQEIIWGAGYRLNYFGTKTNFNISYPGPDDTRSLGSAFVQDTLTIVPDRLRLTGGVKLEDNHYTGLEVQPSARLAWTPTLRQTVWTAVSRGVRTPSRVDDALLTPATIPTAPPTIYQYLPTSHPQSEAVVAYELGYRIQPVDKVQLGVSIFYNHYDHLRNVYYGAPDKSAGYSLVPATTYYTVGADSCGGEFSAEWQPVSYWRLRSQYSLARVNSKARPEPGQFPFGTYDLAKDQEGNTPKHQAQLQSSLTLDSNWDLDVIVRYVDRVPAYNVPSYVSGDARLAWRPRPDLELSLTGQNLFNSGHTEFSRSVGNSASLAGAYFEPSVFGKLAWRF